MAVDLLGLTIFLIGVALIVLELTMPGLYIGVAGTVLIVVGLVQMAWSEFLFSTWSPFVVVVVAIAAVAGSVTFYRRFAPPASAPDTLASDALLQREGIVTTEVVPNSTKGKVKIGGISWSADASERIPEGTSVVVRRVEGVHVVVERVPMKPGLGGAEHGG